MMFEYIRPIDPSPARPVLEQLEPVRDSDAPDLAELVAHASTRAEDTAPLACPEPPSRRLDLPHFSSISLAEVVLQPSRVPTPAPVPDRTRSHTPSPTDPLPVKPRVRVLLGPGAMTMTLAIFATLAFGVAVAAQVH